MANVEIDENELANLRRVYQIADAVGKHPEGRNLLNEAIAVAVPDQAGPEVRLRKELNDRFSSVEKLLLEEREERKREKEAEAEERAKRSLERRWLTTRNQARETGYTDEGLEKLEDFMEKNGIADHTLAMPAFEKLNPPPEPVVSGNSNWGFFDNQGQAGEGDAAMKALYAEDYDSFLGQSINTALKEVRGR